MSAAEPTRFLPGRHPIDAYGDGGFRFGDMSHRGSILALPSGIRAWDVIAPEAIDAAALAPVFAEIADMDFLLVGAGTGLAPLAGPLRARFRDARVNLDIMPTGVAARTYNILLAENRRVGAALIAVG